MPQKEEPARNSRDGVLAGYSPKGEPVGYSQYDVFARYFHDGVLAGYPNQGELAGYSQKVALAEYSQAGEPAGSCPDGIFSEYSQEVLAGYPQRGKPARGKVPAEYPQKVVLPKNSQGEELAGTLKKIACRVLSKRRTCGEPSKKVSEGDSRKVIPEGYPQNGALAGYNRIGKLRGTLKTQPPAHPLKELCPRDTPKQKDIRVAVELPGCSKKIELAERSQIRYLRETLKK